MPIKPVKIAIIGCGNISSVYFKGCQAFPILDLVACGDVIMERAQAKGAEYGVPARSVAEIINDPEIEFIVNLTIPKVHSEIGLAALEAGKCIYNEKPLAVKREDGKQMLALAKNKGLLVGGAPDTFLGGGLQTCRKIIDDGWIGTPVAAVAFMMGHGPEQFHPDPEFFYKTGGGPMFDMGPYYMTALVNLLGPVKRVTGSAHISFPERTILSQPKRGQIIQVEVPTHVAGVLDFASGAVGTIITSFDVWAAQLPNIEIYGSQGSLRVPDPNTFGGPIMLRRAGAKDWTEIALSHGYSEQSRGLGVADMAYAWRTGRKHRASGELTYHVLDLMHSVHDASAAGKHVFPESTCERPAPLPMGLLPFTLDE